MSGAWVAGGVRASALLRRRLGRAGVRALATQPSLDDAVRVLADSPYGHDLRVGMSLAAAEDSVSAALLWQLRVLAGWQPPTGADAVRLLVGWYEVANIVEHVRELTSENSAHPFRLGSLTTAWSRLQPTRSLEQLRAELAKSAWGDPGAATPAAITVGVYAGWARRVVGSVPEASSWAVGGLALLVARERFVVGRRLTPPVLRLANGLLGSGPLSAASLPEYVERLSTEARWALAGMQTPTQLWRAEVAWWDRVERDGLAMVRGSGFDRARVVGCVAALAVDAWRVRAALQIAARGGRPSEVFDAVA
jgi:hypothetical protein